jgi:hypothetical protein
MVKNCPWFSEKNNNDKLKITNKNALQKLFSQQIYYLLFYFLQIVIKRLTEDGGS